MKLSQGRTERRRLRRGRAKIQQDFMCDHQKILVDVKTSGDFVCCSEGTRKPERDGARRGRRKF